MIVAGIDIGSRASKAVLLRDGKILSSAITDTGPESVKSSEMAMAKLLNGTGVSLRDIEHIVATGYGRVLVPFAQENISEISCHARGVNGYFPEVRTILDMGGQDCKAIRCEADGRVSNFIMNDKCAGGTGRFLEMIAEVLNTPLSDIGDAALSSKKAIPFNTICAVFAKSEAIAHLRNGVSKNDILAGLNEAIATRCLNLLKRVNVEKEFAISGGIAKNRGIVAKISEKVGLKPLLSEDPQIIGALGAALFAQDRCTGVRRQEELKINYGYSDATGDYFITIDSSLCDGCQECIAACPARIFEMFGEDHGPRKARVKESMRKRLAFLCPGFKSCGSSQKMTCQAVCRKNAISHTW